ncbi:MAG TPA: orotate phosphoribosyltransferase [Clostridiales bacterium]|jgi:orotate phosphoribosyltransferase|nr:orotate phosphoribosyltransferase [Clostridiales bacterium]
MEGRSIKIYAPDSKKVSLKVIPGHFATSHSHINLYIDLTSTKSRLSEAMEAAHVLSKQYVNSVVIDTIVCLDNCEVIGGFLAKELTDAGIMSLNAHKTMYIISPEYNTNGQMIFRDCNQGAIYNKNILLLVASVTTGDTLRRSLECIRYYGGRVNGISAIFSAVEDVENTKVNSIFRKKDLPDYQSYKISECPLCKTGLKLDAIVNGYGYMRL